MFFILILSEFFIILMIINKNTKLFYLLWNLQIFLFLLFSILFNFEQTFQIKDPDQITILVFILFIVFVESLIIYYLIRKEKSIKNILLVSASSSSIIVLLIVTFVMIEGAPAFIETNPIDFITGTSFSAAYDISQEETRTIITTSSSYDFSIQPDAEQIYSKPNESYTTTIALINSGSYPDTYYISVNATPSHNIMYSLSNYTVIIDPNGQQTINLTCESSKIDRYTISISVESKSSTKTRETQISYIISDYSFFVDPSSYSIITTGVSSGLQSIPLQITNNGNYNDSYNISIESPSLFKPSIIHDEIQWDYENSSGTINIHAGETKQVTLRPRLITKVDGTYQIDVLFTSENNPDINNHFTLLFSYKQYDFFHIDDNKKSATIDTPAVYNITFTRSENEEYILRFSDIPISWNILLKNDNKTILENQQEVTINPSTIESLTIHISPTNQIPEGETLTTDISIIKPGLQPTFGILPFIIGTIITTVIAVLIAAPLGISVAIFLSHYCPIHIRRILRPLFELLAGIPSVLYGLWGWLTFGPFLTANIYPLITQTIGKIIPFFSETSNMGDDVMTASIVLSFMILPIILTLSTDAINSVPRSLQEGSLALGATRWITIRRIILPVAKSGIVSSIVLGTGRAIGETMAVLMIMKYTISIPTSVFDRAGTMTSVIASQLGSRFSMDLARHALFAVALVLFFMIFLLNIVIFFINKESKIKLNPFQSKKEKEHKEDTKKFQIISELEQKEQIKKKFTIIENKTNNQKIDSIYFQKKTRPKLQLMPSRKMIIQEKIIIIILIAAALLVSAFLISIIGDIIVNGGLNLKPEYILERQIGEGIEGGYANAIIGSLQLVGVSLAFATPFSLGSAIYIQEYTKRDNLFTKVIMFASDTLASTPSIVFGAFGFIFFVWYLHFGLSVLSGGLTLAFMIMPIMLRSSIEAIKSIPREYAEGSYALGATKWQTIQKVILPPAVPGISSGTIISIGRAIGETAAVMFTAGYAAHIASSIMQPAANLPNMIYDFFERTVNNPILGEKVYSASFILIIVVLILNAVSRLISYKSSKMMKE